MLPASPGTSDAVREQLVRTLNNWFVHFGRTVQPHSDRARVRRELKPQVHGM